MEYIVAPILKDYPISHKDMLFQDMWSLVSGSLLKYRTFCQKLRVLQDRWSLMAVVSQDRLTVALFTVEATLTDCTLLASKVWCSRQL